jgi:1-aminocyclopropane-1-carboxylate deaminase
MLDTNLSILQEVIFTPINTKGNRLFIKRDDLIHAEISGNKWRKLKYNVQSAIQLKNKGILTFGGAYSNHLVATAAACSLAGLRSVGVVRGHELNSESNDTLKRCVEYGMVLHFVSRSDYDFRNERTFLEELAAQFPNYYMVPEGGANYLGMIGCQEIWKEINESFDIVCLAQGTATTSAGLLIGLPSKTDMWVVPVLKGYYSHDEMKVLMSKSGFESDMIIELLERVEVKSEYHFGGYGKYSAELLDFIEEFYQETSVPLDPVYTGKVMLGIVREVQRLNLKNQKILFLHTGGIQGAKAIFEKEKRTIF